MHDESERVESLLDAQAKAVALFSEVQSRRLVTAGESEQGISERIRDLAQELFGVRRGEDERIVRSGTNTLQPYQVRPEDRLVDADEVVVCDLGGVFEQGEAHFRRTAVLGESPVKLRLRDDLQLIFEAGRRAFESDPGITGEELFTVIAELTTEAGWEFGSPHAGHLVGEVPPKTVAQDEVMSFIAPGNTQQLRREDKAGRPCHWVLEVHLVDRDRGFGGFHDQLLDLG